MALEGGCYCGKVRFAVEGEPILRGQCHCRECQYLTGGAPNIFMLVAPAGYSYTAGAPKAFKRGDIDNAVTREFCAECGTHLTTRIPNQPYMVVKAGVLDDPALFGQPQMAIYTCDKQPFHQIAEGLAQFEKLPPRG